jgi:predicted kinase
MTKLIIICGLTASGKTTLAEELSKKINVVCLHKDSIKSNLYNILELSTLEDSKRIGLQSVNLLFKLAEEQLKNGVDLIIESPFNHISDYELFHRWEKKYKLDVWKIICHMDDENREKRFKERLKIRHICHHDGERLANGEGLGKLEDYKVYEKMPGEKIEVVTNKPIGKIVTMILEEIK